MTVSAAEICAMIEAEVTKMSVNFDHYKIFYYVAKYQNITFAADLLFLSQPTVSRCIQNLEAETGCRLFDRSKKGVSLTPGGPYTLSVCVPGLRSAFRGGKRARKLPQHVGGKYPHRLQRDDHAQLPAALPGAFSQRIPGR